MNKFLNSMKMENNLTETENGAVAYKSTLNACLDAFGGLGAMRDSDKGDIIKVFSKAFAEDSKTATKILFYMRDIRGGQGSRRVFRVIANWLADNHPEFITNNLENFLHYGRGDDLLSLIGTECEAEMMKWAKTTLENDLKAFKEQKPCSLLAKWMPSENTSSPETRAAAKKFIKAFKMAPREYRKMLSTLRGYIDIVEKKMSSNQWESINYNALPAKASMIYSDAFFNHDEDRYTEYVQKLAIGESKVNAASLFPVDIVHKCMNRSDSKKVKLLDAMWNALPNYLEGKEETGICVVDTSGSMSGTPMEVAISLGIYCADKCRGPFKNHFITFSAEPELQEVRGATIAEKVSNLERANWDSNTNLEAVFDLILRTAKNGNCSQKDLPSKLYIISDMQFDLATADIGYPWEHPSKRKEPFMQKMKAKFDAAGYSMPSIVYWNVRASKCGMFQETYQGENCCMVSGYSASLFKSIIEGTTYEEEKTIDENGNEVVVVREKLDPMTVMTTTLSNERYNPVWVG